MPNKPELIKAAIEDFAILKVAGVNPTNIKEIKE